MASLSIMPGVADRIRQKLAAALAPARLDVVDESHRHVGHAGSRPGGETHFRVEIVSLVFAGKSRIARHRLVYELLAAELREDVHALTLITCTPDEAAAGGR
jgi:BolA protein